MKPRLSGFALASLLMFTLSARGADSVKPPTSPTTQRVVKLISTSADERAPFGGRGFNRGPGGGGPGRNNPPGNNQPAASFMVVTAPEGGQPVKLLVTDEFRRKLPSLSGERGELINITVKAGTLGTEMVSAASPFDGPKFLKNPKVYLYDGIGQQRVGVQIFTTAKLSRFGQSREVLIPNRPSFDGAKPQPDPALVSTLNALTVGDAVEVEIAPGPARNLSYLIDIEAAHDPLIGEFVKLTSLRDAAGKTVPGIVIDLDGQEKSYALPAQTPGSPANVLASAVNAAARTLKPGHSVRFDVEETDGKLPTIREIRLDGAIEPVNDKYFSLISTYVRVEFSENFFSRDKELNVDYRPGSTNPQDQMLERGVSRVLASDAESSRIKLSEDQTKQLTAAMDMKVGRDVKPTAQERAQWNAAYNAWVGARDEAARGRIEQELLVAGQELSGRWRKELQGKYHSLRTMLTAEQLEEVMKLGEKKQMAPGV